MKPEIRKLPDAELHYFPIFLEAEEAKLFFEFLLKEISWKQENIKLFGKQIPQPRLTAFFAENKLSYAYSGLELSPEIFLPELFELKNRIEKLTGFEFNTCMANLYRDGGDSMGWHSDDEKVLGKNPAIASVSLGAVRDFQLQHKTQKRLKEKIRLLNGSLLLMHGSIQHSWKHQLPKTKKKVPPRINLTFRKVY